MRSSELIILVWNFSSYPAEHVQVCVSDSFIGNIWSSGGLWKGTLEAASSSGLDHG
jgi:hypothetical protein